MALFVRLTPPKNKHDNGQPNHLKMYLLFKKSKKAIKVIFHCHVVFFWGLVVANNGVITVITVIKWPYKWVIGVIILLIGVITSRGPTLLPCWFWGWSFDQLLFIQLPCHRTNSSKRLEESRSIASPIRPVHSRQAQTLNGP